MQKRLLAVLILAVVAFALTACAAPEPAELVDYANVCDQANDDKRISAVGYFDPGVSVYCSDSGGDYRCGMDFLETLDAAEGFTADMLEGSGPNQMSKLPDSYSNSDIKIQTNDGGTIGIGQKARISGEMLIGEGVCLMSVDRVDPAD